MHDLFPYDPATLQIDHPVCAQDFCRQHFTDLLEFKAFHLDLLELLTAAPGKKFPALEIDQLSEDFQTKMRDAVRCEAVLQDERRLRALNYLGSLYRVHLTEARGDRGLMGEIFASQRKEMTTAHYGKALCGELSRIAEPESAFACTVGAFHDPASAGPQDFMEDSLEQHLQFMQETSSRLNSWTALADAAELTSGLDLLRLLQDHHALAEQHINCVEIALRARLRKAE